MRFRGFKKFISVTLAVMMIVSTLICGAVATDAATYKVGDTITYQFMVNTGCKIQAFEGAVYFPADKLSVVTQIDDDGSMCEAIVYGNSKGSYIAHATGGVMKFQASSANNVYNFTTDVTMIQVKFFVDNADFSPTEIYTELSNIYDKDYIAKDGNNPYSYKNVINGKVISGGKVDLDNGTIEKTTTYTVVFNYKTEDGDQTLTKTATTAETNIEDIVNSAMPTIVNKMYDYTLGDYELVGTTITANLVETKKLYTVTVDNNFVGEYEYMEMATVKLSDGTDYTFYVTDDAEIDSKTVTMDAVTLSHDALTVTDEKVSMDLLATAKVDKFARMGVAFATSDKLPKDIESAVLKVTTDTAVSNKIAVHNSTVDSPNVSGYYQFVYAPYVSKEMATAHAATTLYFYTFVVDTNGKVYVSSGVPVDLKNAYA